MPRAPGANYGLLRAPGEYEVPGAVLPGIAGDAAGREGLQTGLRGGHDRLTALGALAPVAQGGRGRARAWGPRTATTARTERSRHYAGRGAAGGTCPYQGQGVGSSPTARSFGVIDDAGYWVR